MTRSLLHPRMLAKLDVFFDRTCTIQYDAGSTTDGYGEPAKSWTDVIGLVNVACSVGDLDADDAVGLNVTSSVVSMLKVLLQGYCPQITGDMGMLLSGVFYKILSVAHSQENSHTRLIVGRLT